MCINIYIYIYIWFDTDIEETSSWCELMTLNHFLGIDHGFGDPDLFEPWEKGWRQQFGACNFMQIYRNAFNRTWKKGFPKTISRYLSIYIYTYVLSHFLSVHVKSTGFLLMFIAWCPVFCFQEPVLFNTSVRNNILPLGRPWGGPLWILRIWGPGLYIYIYIHIYIYTYICYLYIHYI